MNLKILLIFIGAMAANTYAYESFLNNQEQKSVFIPIKRTDELSDEWVDDLVDDEWLEDDLELSEFPTYGNIGHFMTSIFYLGTPI